VALPGTKKDIVFSVVFLVIGLVIASLCGLSGDRRNRLSGELEQLRLDNQRLTASLRQADGRTAELEGRLREAQSTNSELRKTIDGLTVTVGYIKGAADEIERSSFIFADTTERGYFLIGELERIIAETGIRNIPP
jgi:chromosome segregation ATPase